MNAHTVLDCLYSTVFYPKKWTTGYYGKEIAGGLVKYTILDGALFFVPLWTDAETLRAAVLPRLQCTGVERTLIGTTWTTQDPAATLEITLPTTKTLGVYNESGTAVTIIEVYPADLTPLT